MGRSMSEPVSEIGTVIVVGVDGSEGSKAALRWAVRQAGFTGAVVQAVIAWQYPTFLGWAAIGTEDINYAPLAEETVIAAIAEVAGPEHAALVKASVAEGYAGQILVEASADAELLVVGSRGYSAFADALLGSVSTYCVHHGHCPVTVIRPSGQQDHGHVANRSRQRD
jgi:nucleotide-binding universal stress UspA family protein